MKGLGWARRETGQSRVPAPPESMTGVSDISPLRRVFAENRSWPGALFPQSQSHDPEIAFDRGTDHIHTSG